MSTRISHSVSPKMPTRSTIWKHFTRSGTTGTCADRAKCRSCEYEAAAVPKRLSKHLLTCSFTAEDLRSTGTEFEQADSKTSTPLISATDVVVNTNGSRMDTRVPIVRNVRGDQTRADKPLLPRPTPPAYYSDGHQQHALDSRKRNYGSSLQNKMMLNGAATDKSARHSQPRIEMILKRRKDVRGCMQYLVKWKGRPAKCNTWISGQALHRK
jgi:hypothetical protein